MITIPTKNKLMEMAVGSMITVSSQTNGHLIEIHRVFGGWIYVFQLNQSNLVTQFVKEIKNEMSELL